MTGANLREILVSKWGKSYDIQLRRSQGKVFVQVMWKYLEQASFPMTEEEYLNHLETIASYLMGMGGVAQFQNYVASTTERPRLGKAVSLALDLGDRSSEWIIE